MSLNQKKRLVGDFLRRCNAYADDQLAKYRSGPEPATSVEALAIQDKIGHWSAYKAFNEHAMAELETDVLDHWFD